MLDYARVAPLCPEITNILFIARAQPVTQVLELFL